MDKDVLITISGLLSAGDSDDRVDLIVPGQYYRKNEKHFLVYEEIQDESGTRSNTLMRIDADEVLMKKRGGGNAEMLFTTGGDTFSKYETPYGTLELLIHTNRIRIRETENKIVLMLDYYLKMDEQKLSDNYVRIEVVSKSEGISLR